MEDRIEVIIKRNGEEMCLDSGTLCIVYVVDGRDSQTHIYGSTNDGAHGIFNALGSLVVDICDHAVEGTFS